MNLSKLSDEQLLESTWQLALADRRLVTALLHHLNEIALRRLYAKESYPSLFEYCVRVLRFTESQAQKRISSARVLKELPQIEDKISRGSLSLTAISRAHAYFRAKPHTPEEKLKFLELIENKTTREVEKIFAALISGNPALTVIRFTATPELVEKIDRLKNVFKTSSLEELFDKLADVALQRYDPLKKAARNLQVANRRNASAARQVIITRHIPPQIRHQVWLRDRGLCTFPGCGSQYGLELDHIQPFALGGRHTLENLRLRCRAHNQLSAEQTFGKKNMSSPRLT